MIYSEKIKNPKWQKKRLEVFNRDNFKCCTCGDQETELHVHHLKYTGEPHEAPLEDLQTLCKHCHWYFTFFHKFLSKSINNHIVLKIIKQDDWMIVSFSNTDMLFKIREYDLWFNGNFMKNSKFIYFLYEQNKITK